MKAFKFYLLCLFFFMSGILAAQVQIDKQLQLTGNGADGKITGIKNVSASQDAVSADYIQRDSLKFAVAGGSADAYTVNLSPAVTGQYTLGMVVHFKAGFTNGGPATLSVNGLTAATLKKNYNVDLAANDIKNGQMVSVMYDGSNFQLYNAPAASGGFTHYVGEIYGGGVVFYVYNIGGGEHGLIVSLNDIGSTSVWSNKTTTLIGSTAQSLWHGATNSAAIVGQSGHTTSAAQLCLSYTGGGYNDWYLPALDELALIYRARFELDQQLPAAGGTILGYGEYNAIEQRYWSSTEFNANCGWFFDFGLGSLTFTNKNPQLLVRAVRAF